MSIEKKRIKQVIQRFLTPNTRYVKKRINGHEMILDTYDTWMKDNFLWCDIYEPETSKFIEENVKEYDIVLDIGAHIGYHSLNFAIERADVLSFEPDLETFKLLCANVKGYTVTPINQAVSDKMGEVILYRSINRSAWNSLFPRRDSIPQIVKCDTIDNIELHKVDWVKIDVEGAEIQVLQGMKDTLRMSPNPRVIIEWLPKNDGDFEGIMKFFEGWKCKPLDHNMLFWKE